MSECGPIVYIGYDNREPIAFDVLASSIKLRTEQDVKIFKLDHRVLRKQRRFTRPWLIDADTGNFRDLIDGKPFSTEFSHTRFLVPDLQDYQGWALFMDCDMIFQSDIKKLWELRDNRFAVMVVKHNHKGQESKLKMDDRVQLNYHRKNWSSFVMWNCAHPSNRRMNCARVNMWSGTQLHCFSWLSDNEIGELPKSYNWMAGVSPVDVAPDVIHYTEGGPWFENCLDVPLADLWVKEYKLMKRHRHELIYENLPCDDAP